MKSAEKLLERMRLTKSGYGQKDFETLYTGFGFIKEECSNHTKYIHVKFKKIAIVARHTELPPGYAREAVKIIDEIKLLIKEIS